MIDTFDVLPSKGPQIKLTTPPITIKSEKAVANLVGYSSAITRARGVWMKHLRKPKTADVDAIQIKLLPYANTAKENVKMSCASKVFDSSNLF